MLAKHKTVFEQPIIQKTKKQNNKPLLKKNKKAKPKFFETIKLRTWKPFRVLYSRLQKQKTCTTFRLSSFIGASEKLGW